VIFFGGCGCGFGASPLIQASKTSSAINHSARLRVPALTPGSNPFSKSAFVFAVEKFSLSATSERCSMRIKKTPGTNVFTRDSRSLGMSFSMEKTIFR
jgi:hypothetical protein